MKARNKNRRVKSFHPVIILFVITISSFFGAADIYGQTRRRSVKKSTSAAQVAKPLPELKLPDLNGAEWSLHQNRGRVVLINFWATWCAPCRAETPMLVNFGKEYKRRGLEIVGIALDDDGAGNVKNFVADYKVDYPILLPVPDSALSRIDPVPTTLLIDADGRLAKKYVGALSENILRTDIEKLIGRLMMKNETTKDAKNTKNTKKRNLTILHTNDLHGHLDSWQGWEGNLNGKTVGGLDRLAAQIEKVRNEAKTNNVLLLDAGDTIGDTMIAAETEGRAVVETMNAMRLDAMVIGNHEPDFTRAKLLERIKQAKFPILAANISNKTDGKLFTRP